MSRFHAYPVRRVSTFGRILALLAAAGLLFFAGHALLFAVRHSDYVAFLISALFVVLSGIGALLAIRGRAE